MLNKGLGRYKITNVMQMYSLIALSHLNIIEITVITTQETTKSNLFSSQTIPTQSILKKDI